MNKICMDWSIQSEPGFESQGGPGCQRFRTIPSGLLCMVWRFFYLKSAKGKSLFYTKIPYQGCWYYHILIFSDQIEEKKFSVETLIWKCWKPQLFCLSEDHQCRVKPWNLGIWRHAPYTSEQVLINLIIFMLVIVLFLALLRIKLTQSAYQWRRISKLTIMENWIDIWA